MKLRFLSWRADLARRWPRDRILLESEYFIPCNCKCYSLLLYSRGPITYYLSADSVYVTFTGYILDVSHRRHDFNCWFINSIPYVI
jgi:hypothetical protein